MLKSTLSIFATVFLLLCITPNESRAVPVNLSGWTATDTLAIAISDDGYSATFSEIDSGAPVSLSTTLDIPADAVSFSFDYELIIPANNEDYFDFFIDDTVFYLFSDGGYSADTESTYSGTYSVLLSPYVGESVDVIFEMSSGWWDWLDDSTHCIESILTISNVDISMTNPVPEPCTILLLGTGLAGLVGLRRRNRARSL